MANKLLTIDDVIADIERAIDDIAPYEKDRNFADNYRKWLKNLNDIKRLTTRKILLIEDGSVDGNNIEELSDMNYKVVVYRQGANLPTLLSSKDENDDF